MQDVVFDHEGSVGRVHAVLVSVVGSGADRFLVADLDDTLVGLVVRREHGDADADDRGNTQDNRADDFGAHRILLCVRYSQLSTVLY